MNENENMVEALEKTISDTEMPDSEKVKLLKTVQKYKGRKINLLITGATGCGKSSTINALFGKEVSKVGQGADPETMTISRYELDNLVIWDSPGLGDSPEKDDIHAKKIIDLIHEKDDEGNALIDLVLVIIDGSGRDMGTSENLIINVIIPALGKERKDRILVAINKCDMVDSGRHFNLELNKPDAKLEKSLEEKTKSVHDRIYNATGVNIEPICYAAGFKEDDEDQDPPYNLSKLLYFIIKHTPKQKRIVYASNISKDPEVWKSSDELKDYNRESWRSMFEDIAEAISDASDIGAEIGEALLGEPGRYAGKFIAGVVGGVCTAATRIVSGLSGLVGGLFNR